MIQFENINYKYGKSKQVFNNLSINFEKGRIYGLLGKNGSGKSTLLRLAAGLLHNQNGTVLVNNFKSKERPKAMLGNIFYIPEEVFMPELNIKQFADLYGGLYPNFSKEQFTDYLKQFDVEVTGKLADHSYGQQKKIYISFALACQPQYLLMDEPTNGLDIPSKMQFRKILAGYVNEEKLVLISTHQVRDLDNLMDTLVILENSNILLHASISTIQQKLYFDRVAQLPQSNVLYHEKIWGGYDVILPNPSGEPSMMDTEKLFNAVLSQPTVFANELN
jgi:ABC-2 type transport system ATP-binding protein